jgi:hypothetical protein
VTHAEYDHVGLVVPSAHSAAGLNLLEATAEGCTVYPLQSRLRAYAHGFTHYMCLRRLEGAAGTDTPETQAPQVATGSSNSSGSGNAAARASVYAGPPRLRNPAGWEAAVAVKLKEFSFKVDGKPYGFSVGKLFQRKELDATAAAASAAVRSSGGGGEESVLRRRAQDVFSLDVDAVSGEYEDVALDGPSPKGSGSSSKSDKSGQSGESGGSKAKKSGSRVARLLTLPAKEVDLAKKKTFFCSELVAAAQLGAGLLQPSCNASFFWPGSFAVGGDVDAATAQPYRYGPEILIDCREVEVGKALSF